MPRRRAGHARPGPKKKRPHIRVINGMRYSLDRQYGTLKGAQRRVEGTKREFTKESKYKWFTWNWTGRDAKGKRVK